MATKADFTEAEWSALQKGLTGSAMLVSLSDRDFTDTFGEVGAMTKYLQGQQVAGSSELIRELAKTHGTGFGVTTGPDKMRAETMASLQTGARGPGREGARRGRGLSAARPRRRRRRSPTRRAASRPSRARCSRRSGRPSAAADGATRRSRHASRADAT